MKRISSLVVCVIATSINGVNSVERLSPIDELRATLSRIEGSRKTPHRSAGSPVESLWVERRCPELVEGHATTRATL